MFLAPVDEIEVQGIIRKLKNKRTSGPDGIPDFLVKECGKELLTPLTHIINCSFETGIFPERLKVARIKPIFKNGAKTDKNNYRPIALLSIFSKIIETAVAKRLTNFCDKYKIIKTEQHGFVKSKNTGTALLQFAQGIIRD